MDEVDEGWILRTTEIAGGAQEGERIVALAEGSVENDAVARRTLDRLRWPVADRALIGRGAIEQQADMEDAPRRGAGCGGEFRRRAEMGAIHGAGHDLIEIGLGAEEGIARDLRPQLAGSARIGDVMRAVGIAQPGIADHG